MLTIRESYWGNLNNLSILIIPIKDKDMRQWDILISLVSDVDLYQNITLTACIHVVCFSFLCMCVHRCTFLWRSNAEVIECLSLLFLTNLVSTLWLARLSSSDPVVSASQCWGCSHMLSRLAFCKDAWGLNLGPHGCAASIYRPRYLLSSSVYKFSFVIYTSINLEERLK